MRFRFLCWFGSAFAFLLFFDALGIGRCASDELEGDNKEPMTVEGGTDKADEQATKGDAEGSADADADADAEDGPTDPPSKEDVYFYLFDKDSDVTEFEAPSDKTELEKEKPRRARTQIITHTDQGKPTFLLNEGSRAGGDAPHQSGTSRRRPSRSAAPPRPSPRALPPPTHASVRRCSAGAGTCRRRPCQ